jgi:hypothetical protein
MPTHTTGALRLTANLCAFSLIIASAGFGGVFAWTVAKEHSYALAILTVLFAVALEGLKPLAIAYSLSSFASLSIIRGVALLLLGGAAIAYSLTQALASDKTSVRRAIHTLAASGLVAMTATKTGTVIKSAA